MLLVGIFSCTPTIASYKHCVFLLIAPSGFGKRPYLDEKLKGSKFVIIIIFWFLIFFFRTRSCQTAEAFGRW